MCSSRKKTIPPTDGNGNSEGGRGGSRGRQFPRGVGLASRVFFFPGAPSTIDEQVISHFIVNRCFKAKIIFSSMIFNLPSAECCFFFTFTASTIVYVVTRLSSAHG